MQSVQASRSSESRIRILCCLAVFAMATVCTAQEEKPAKDAVAASVATQDHKAPKDAVENARKKQIADESAELLSMALALKAEVDKTTKDTLSLNVIKKADQIEKLAKQVKEKMKNSGS
jgi:hypothetical protein